MFLGKYEHAIDKKGRLILPSRFREVLNEKYVDSFIITKWMENCLSIYPINEWKNLEQKLNSLPKGDINARHFTRMLFANASEAAIDKQGRIFIPLQLRSHVNISRNVIVIGVGSRIEIWDKPQWEEYNKKIEKPFEEIAQKLSDMGI